MTFLINLMTEEYVFTINLKVEAKDIFAAVSAFSNFFKVPGDITERMHHDSCREGNALMDFHFTIDDSRLRLNIFPIDEVPSLN